MIELDEHQKCLIRKTVHSFFSANREVQNNEEIPNISHYNVLDLDELKFKYVHK
jgi:hypothetical protein